MKKKLLFIFALLCAVAQGVTAIEGIRMMDDNRNTPYYDLQGRQLNGKPTQKGVYINQGRKVVNK